ncbi:MAG: peptidylprolyl isomerase [Cyanobacteria bacterium P01_D01_bin.44]
MNTALQIGSQTLNTADLIPLLKRYQLLPQLQRDLIIDQAIAEIELTPQDIQTARQQLEVKYDLFSVEAQQAFCTQRGLSPEELEPLAIRQFKVERFKQNRWGNQLTSYFLQRKHQLDQVIYSLIRTRDSGLAQELYFRIQENEDSFANLAKTYSEGPEAKLGGLVGPVALSQPHPQMARMLSVSEMGQLWSPCPIGDWFIILRLEDRLPVEFDDLLKQRLLNECFENWLAEKISIALV